MSEASVARVYATALFAAATEAGQTEVVREQLGEFAEALVTSTDLAGALADPKVQGPQKQRIVADLTSGGDQLVRNTVRLMLDKGRIVLVPEVSRQYGELAAQAARLIDVEVTSAVPLDAETEKKLVQRFEQATSRQVRLAKTVDAEIIGGLVVRVGDVVLDASLRARVDQLRARIQRVETRGDA